MSTEMAKSAISLIEANFKRSFPAEGIKKIWPDIRAQPDKAIEKAVDYIVLNRSYLPSPADLLEAVKVEAKKIAAEETRRREREWAETKGGETREQMNRKGSIFSKEQSDRHGKEAVKAIKLMMTPAKREDKLECFRVMDEAYPGAGWAKAGMELKRHWEEGRTV